MFILSSVLANRRCAIILYEALLGLQSFWLISILIPQMEDQVEVKDMVVLTGM